MLVSSSTSSLVRHPALAKPGMSGVLITEPVAMRKDLAVTVSADPLRPSTWRVVLSTNAAAAPKEIEISLFQLFAPVVCEFRNQPVFSGNDLDGIDSDLSDA